MSWIFVIKVKQHLVISRFYISIMNQNTLLGVDVIYGIYK